MVQWILAMDGTLLRADQVVRVNITEAPKVWLNRSFLEAFTDEQAVNLTFPEPKAVTLEAQKILAVYLAGSAGVIDMNELVLRAREKLLPEASSKQDSEADDFERGRFFAADEKGCL